MSVSFRALYRVGLLAGCAGLSTMAHAQQSISAEDATALRAEIAALRAQVQALQQRADQADADKARAIAAVTAGQQPTSAPVPQASPPLALASGAGTTEQKPVDVAWKGAAQLKQGEWSFKPRGRMQFDTVWVGAPDGANDKGLGVASEVRRIRLGGEGTMPGNFGYKLEVELSDNKVDLVDTYISWQSGPFTVRVGNQNQFQSLDELIGDTTGVVMERAAFTDAFNFERRLGIATEWQKGPLLLQAGLFSDDVNALSNANNGDRNNSFGVDGRIVLAPKLGDTQLHFAASGHYRDLNDISGEGVRYRQRPFSHATNSYFMDSGLIKANSETHYGLEFAAVRGRWHAAAETHWMKVDRIGGENPTFFGGYGEVGFYLTPGDTRVYKNGIFDRSPPKNPVSQGGMGSLQLTLRYDYLDMNDRDIRGGTQNGYIAALVWTPINLVRLNLNYARLDYKDAVALANGNRNYSADVLGLRAELDY